MVILMQTTIAFAVGGLKQNLVFDPTLGAIITVATALDPSFLVHKDSEAGL